MALSRSRALGWRLRAFSALLGLIVLDLAIHQFAKPRMVVWGIEPVVRHTSLPGLYKAPRSTPRVFRVASSTGSRGAQTGVRKGSHGRSHWGRYRALPPALGARGGQTLQNRCRVAGSQHRSSDHLGRSPQWFLCKLRPTVGAAHRDVACKRVRRTTGAHRGVAAISSGFRSRVGRGVG